MSVANTIKAKVTKLMGKVTNAYVYDMSTKEARQIQVKEDFEAAKTEKTPYVAKMVENTEYYNNRPYTYNQALELKDKLGINFTPPVLPLAFVEVESQIDDRILTFQFRGREGQDEKKSKEREKAANYVLYNNGIEELNLDNERALNTIGNAFWKVAWDGSINGMNTVGDIILGNPDPANIFPDPNAYDIDDCEFIIYAFRLHRRKAKRMFGKIIDQINNDGERTTTEIYGKNQAQSANDDETMLVIEYWYRDDEGDVACSIQINYVEVKHIPKYWEVTRHSGNQMFPIIKYGKIPVRKSFWDKGEVETCKDLFDAANREFITAILNDAFMANDITLYEQDALAEGQEMSNTPGAQIKTKPNKIDKVRRLGGISENSGILNMINFIKEQIQETNGNYDASQGKEPVRVTTASGIAQLNEKADARKVTKKAGRTEGFKRLAQLIDWTVLEFYNHDRMLMVGAEDPNQTDPKKEPMQFNSTNHAETGSDSQPYYPKVDVEITAGDGIKKSKAFTLQATQELLNIIITPENIGIALAQLELLELPNKQEIRDSMIMAVRQQIQQREAAMQPPPAKEVAPPEPIDPHKNAFELTKLQYEAKLQDDKQAHEIKMATLKDQWDKEKIILQGEIAAKIAKEKPKETVSAK